MDSSEGGHQGVNSRVGLAVGAVTKAGSGTPLMLNKKQHQ